MILIPDQNRKNTQDLRVFSYGNDDRGRRNHVKYLKTSIYSCRVRALPDPFNPPDKTDGPGQENPK